jgi:hypothetical protein
MSESKTLSAEINFNASQQDIVRILAAQFAHMDQGEARAALERLHNNVLSEEQFLAQFQLVNLDAPYAHVIRKADGHRGTMSFIDVPRLYFDFHPEEENDASTP